MATSAFPRVARVEWPGIAAYLRAEWRSGENAEHISIVGPTGSGKTHLALALLELRPYVIVVATKRQDGLVRQLEGEYRIVRKSLNEIQWTEDKRPLTPRILLWPPSPSGIEKRMAAQRAILSEAFDWIDDSRNWTVLLDEALWLSHHLGLRKQLEALWFGGRTQGISLVTLAQRPVQIPRLAFSSPRFFFLARTGDRDDLERLRDIATHVPREWIEDTLRRLDEDSHEMLFIDGRKGRLARVIAPPRGARPSEIRQAA